MFWIYSNESRNTLRIGQKFTATVKKIIKKGVLCDLSCGVLGLIPFDDLADNNDFELPEKPDFEQLIPEIIWSEVEQ